jgi:uncharacterized membrane protein
MFFPNLFFKNAEKYFQYRTIITLKEVVQISQTMSRYEITMVIAALSVFVLFVNLSVITLAQTTFQIQYTNLTLYRDGLVHCEQLLRVDETTPDVVVPLLCNSPENVILLDEEKRTTDYKISESNLTAYTLGSNQLKIEYDTTLLTQKHAEVWTIITDYQYEIAVLLPQNSTVVYINEVPSAIETKQNTMALSLPAGHWEISYILPLVLPDATKMENTGTITNQFKIEYLIAGISALAAATTIFGYLQLRKRGPNIDKIFKNNPQLSKEDQEVVRFLGEREGKAFEAELREKFPDMPRTSLWRLVRRLERLEIVEIKKIGLENQVHLKK